MLISSRTTGAWLANQLRVLTFQKRVCRHVMLANIYLFTYFNLQRFPIMCMSDLNKKAVKAFSMVLLCPSLHPLKCFTPSPPSPPPPPPPFNYNMYVHNIVIIRWYILVNGIVWVISCTQRTIIYFDETMSCFSILFSDLCRMPQGFIMSMSETILNNVVMFN